MDAKDSTNNNILSAFVDEPKEEVVKKEPEVQEPIVAEKSPKDETWEEKVLFPLHLKKVVTWEAHGPERVGVMIWGFWMRKANSS